MKIRTSVRRIAFVALLSAVGVASGSAQQLIVKGEYGNKGGTLPEPGLYAGMLGAVSWSDKLVGPDKNSIDGPNLTQYVFGPMIQYVSKFQLFGAHYSAAAMFPFANTRIEYP